MKYLFLKYAGLAFMVVAFFACNHKHNNFDIPPPGGSFGIVSGISSCKDTKSTHKNNSATYIEYCYSLAEKKLKIKHINAGLSCCADPVTATFSVSDTCIEITEIEDENNCKCSCLYDVDFQIDNLSQQQYRLVINEPYIKNENERISFIIDLRVDTCGVEAVRRFGYPWGEDDYQYINHAYRDSSKLFDMDDFYHDNYMINSLKIVDDVLEVSVSYGGGCASHDFELWQIYSLSSTNDPVLFLSHNANVDKCKSWITSTLKFDLTSLDKFVVDSEKIRVIAVDRMYDVEL